MKNTISVLLVFIGLLTNQACSQTVIIEDVLSNDQGILIKKSESNEDDEYVEGSIYYKESLKTGIERLIYKDVLLDYSIARWIDANRILVVNIYNIAILSTTGEILNEYKFDREEKIIGACINKKSMKAAFLLENSKIKQVSLDLLDLKTNLIKRQIEDINIIDRQPETPFYNMDLFGTKLLLIDYYSDILLINLEDKTINKF